MQSKKNVLLFVFSFMLTSGFSQQFIGYNVDNYAGVNAVTENPAYLAASKYKVHVNLVAISILGGNNAYEFDKSKIFGFNYSHFKEGDGVFKSINTDKKYFYFNTDILGPSFMLNVGNKMGVALTTRMRVLTNGYNLSNSTFRLLGNTDPSFYNLDIQEQDVRAKIHSFAEAGLSFGRILYNNGAHFIKAGITGKYIVGLGAGMAYSNQMLINIDPSKMISKLNGDASLQYSENLDRLDKTNFYDVFKSGTNKGWGIDFGLTYEWRPGKEDWLKTDATPYKLRFGLSVTDIGMVKYTNSTHGKSYLLNGNGHPTSDLSKNDNETYDQYFTRLQTQSILVPVTLDETFTMNLPMAIRANVDYHIYKRIFINANSLVSLVGKSSKSPGYVTTFAVTPRLEKKWFSVYSPVTYNMEKQFTWGAGVRLGPIFAGSGAILSNYLSKKNISATDFHVGVTVPIFQHGAFKKKKNDEDGDKPEEAKEKEEVKKQIIKEENLVKDRDHDGVTDDKDECPDSTGVVALNGCPDKDGDGVADKDDKCPDQVGDAKHGGCPVPDSDGDGVNDDEDKCPNSKGDSTNKGCPAIKKELVSAVARTAKNIYFASGEITLLKTSYPSLNKVVKILKSNPSLRLVVEGHSDNIGTEERNAMFSGGRANAVKDYLVSKGIGADRIDAIGYGPTRPIADNNTWAGRSKNRRVEMRIVNYKE